MLGHSVRMKAFVGLVFGAILGFFAPPAYVLSIGGAELMTPMSFVLGPVMVAGAIAGGVVGLVLGGICQLLSGNEEKPASNWKARAKTSRQATEPRG